MDLNVTYIVTHTNYYIFTDFQPPEVTSYFVHLRTIHFFLSHTRDYSNVQIIGNVTPQIFLTPTILLYY